MDLRLEKGGTRTEEEHAELSRALELALADLPQDLRDLAEERKTMSLAEIARRRDIPRTTVSDYFARIRARLRDSPLQRFLDFSPSRGDQQV